MRLKDAYFCVGCESIHPQDELRPGNECPTCGGKAVVPLTLWIKPLHEPKGEKD